MHVPMRSDFDACWIYVQFQYEAFFRPGRAVAVGAGLFQAAPSGFGTHGCQQAAKFGAQDRQQGNGGWNAMRMFSWNAPQSSGIEVV